MPNIHKWLFPLVASAEILVLVLLVVTPSYYSVNTLNETGKPAQQNQSKLATINNDTKSNLKSWIDKLEKKELDFTYNRGFCKIDIDQEVVCGCLQYKYNTFMQDALKYFPDMTLEEISSLYKDCRSQKRLAMITLLNEKNGWQRWYTSVVVRGLGKPPTYYD